MQEKKVSQVYALVLAVNLCCTFPSNATSAQSNRVSQFLLIRADRRVLELRRDFAFFDAVGHVPRDGQHFLQCNFQL